MAERRHASRFDRRQEPAEPPARRLVEEDALDGLGGTEFERLLQVRFLDVSDP
jgi:hypothetical protein